MLAVADWRLRIIADWRCDFLCKVPHIITQALHKKSARATRLDLKSAIANRQVRNKDVQYPQQLLWLIAHGC